MCPCAIRPQDANTFNVLLSACCKLGLHERVLNHLDSMRTLGLMATAATINTLVTNYTGDRATLEQALRAVQESATQPPQ